MLPRHATIEEPNDQRIAAREHAGLGRRRIAGDDRPHDKAWRNQRRYSIACGRRHLPHAGPRLRGNVETGGIDAIEHHEGKADEDPRNDPPQKQAGHRRVGEEPVFNEPHRRWDDRPDDGG